MIFEKNIDKLFSTNRFVLEPVYKCSSDILNSSSKKVILSGGRNVGKSTVLSRMEHWGINTNNQTIWMKFDKVLNFQNNPYYDSTFLEHFYELMISLKLLSYVKKYYPLTCSYFSDIDSVLIQICNETDNYINNAYYEKLKISKYLKWGEISSIIYDKIKKMEHVDYINCAIDNFDWINHSNMGTQQFLIAYEKIFDKMFITVDDPKVNYNVFKNRLIKDEYDIIDINYSKDINWVKEIIKRRVKYFLKKKRYYFDIDNVFDDNVYQKLIDRCYGNIDMMLETIYETINLSEWLPTDDNCLSLFNDCLNDTVKKDKEYQKISYKPKFYL